jgi:hypothetical protein
MTAMKIGDRYVVVAQVLEYGAILGLLALVFDNGRPAEHDLAKRGQVDEGAHIDDARAVQHQ